MGRHYSPTLSHAARSDATVEYERAHLFRAEMLNEVVSVTPLLMGGVFVGVVG